MEKNEEIEKLSKVIDNVMNESDLFNQTLIEVADRLLDLIICSKEGGYTVKGLSDKALEIFEFIKERYNELPYCNDSDYFQAMLGKLQHDKHEVVMKRIKEEKRKRSNK